MVLTLEALSTFIAMKALLTSSSSNMSDARHLGMTNDTSLVLFVYLLTHFYWYYNIMLTVFLTGLVIAHPKCYKEMIHIFPSYLVGKQEVKMSRELIHNFRHIASKQFQRFRCSAFKVKL